MVTREIKAQAEHYAKLPYTITVEQRDDQGVYYIARVVELPDLFITGDTPAEAVTELENIKKDWIETYLELGNKMPKPLKIRQYSGQYRLRMEPSLHKALALMAEMEGVSLNQYMTAALARAVGRDEQKRKVTSR
jgi:predicted HicB family RNase H-like nuclease